MRNRKEEDIKKLRTHNYELVMGHGGDESHKKLELGKGYDTINQLLKDKSNYESDIQADKQVQKLV